LKNGQQCNNECVKVAGRSTIVKIPPENHETLSMNKCQTTDLFVNTAQQPTSSVSYYCVTL